MRWVHRGEGCQRVRQKRIQDDIPKESVCQKKGERSVKVTIRSLGSPLFEEKKLSRTTRARRGLARILFRRGGGGGGGGGGGKQTRLKYLKKRRVFGGWASHEGKKTHC